MVPARCRGGRGAVLGRLHLRRRGRRGDHARQTSTKAAHEAAQIARRALVAAPSDARDAIHLASMHCIASAFSSAATEYDHALEHAELALTNARRAGTPSSTGLALSQIGWAVATRDPIRAEQSLTEAISLAKSGARLPLRHDLGGPARLRAAAGDARDAASYMRAAVAEALRQGEHTILTNTLQGALAVAAALGELDVAAVLAGSTVRGALAVVPATEIITPGGDPHLAEVAAHIRDQLGDAAYEPAAKGGASMEIDELAEYTLFALDTVIARTT